MSLRTTSASALRVLIKQIQTMSAEDEKRNGQEQQNRTVTSEVETVPITNEPGKRSKRQSN